MRDAAGRYTKGRSGNPDGRPPGRGLQQEIERALAEIVDGKSKLERFAEKVVDLAVEGDLRAAELIDRRLWPERRTVGLEDDLPLLIIGDYTSGVSGYGTDRAGA